jgi:hypothetical protein
VDTDLEERGTRNAELATARAKLHIGVNQPIPSHFSSLKIFATQQEKERLYYSTLQGAQFTLRPLRTARRANNLRRRLFILGD